MGGRERGIIGEGEARSKRVGAKDERVGARVSGSERWERGTGGGTERGTEDERLESVETRVEDLITWRTIKRTEPEMERNEAKMAEQETQRASGCQDGKDKLSSSTNLNSTSSWLPTKQHTLMHMRTSSILCL